jgi:hypothetical protein
MKSLKLFIGSAVSVAAFAALALAKPPEVDVSNDHLNGWQPQTSGASTVSFVNGPGIPPCGSGSAQFTVEAVPDDNSAAQLRNKNYNGTLLGDLIALGYSTYVTTNTGSQAVYIILNVDRDGNGTIDDLLFFEPAYQSVTFFPSNPQGPLALNIWQTWDALHGGWYGLDANTFDGSYGSPGTGVASLAGYIALHPAAVIRNTMSGSGGLRLVAGFGAADWANFLGNADCFTIGTNKKDMVTYDFEAGKRQGPK